MIQRGVAPNTEGWRYPSNQFNQKEATIELKRKEAQMSQEIEGEVRRNLDTNSFAALSSQDYDSSSSHSSATKKQKRVPTPQFDDNQDEESSFQLDDNSSSQFEDGKFNTPLKMVATNRWYHNNPNTDLSPAELETLVEDEIKREILWPWGKIMFHKILHLKN